MTRGGGHRNGTPRTGAAGHGARAARRLAATALAGVLACAGCTAPGGDADLTGPGRAGELRVLAGSELADLEPVLERAAEATGVTVHMEYAGTLDGVQQILGGQTDQRYDAVWFASNRYLNLYAEARTALREETAVMASPVALGVTEDAAAGLGWGDGTEVTWSDIAEAAADGDLAYGMSSPAASNSGFSALVGVASALADTGTALETSDIDEVAPELRAFFSGQELTAGSSGWLAEEFARRSASGDAGLAGLVNYESVLLSLNASGRLDRPLTIVRPADGTVTADYPLSLLDSATDEVAESYRVLVDHLLSAEVQREILQETHRRPMNPEALGEAGLPSVTELPFPTRAETVDRLIAAYFDEIRKPARTVYVLDASISMQGERIEALRAAMETLTGGDDSVSGRFQRFYGRERVTLLPFDGAVRPAVDHELSEEPDPATLDAIRSEVDALELGDGTAAYDAVAEAYRLLEAEDRGDAAESFTSIVLLTDGEVNTGRTFAELRDETHARLPAGLRDVPVFTVLFGEGDAAEMTELAELTGGRTFDARSDSLDAAFREIRGYQ
ncbi:substrate-binding domain-containing protein [Marinactinospora rubrisoli]|uniref:Substrate-binding domain-containing protein n=1 Tax=Marinactinospora rubrisoli TaxID=2715399 RepID=A0ABW2KMF5_9ACTN